MKEMFDKLDNYESRFSDSVWAGVNQHLEAQRAKKRRTRIVLVGSLVLLIGFLVITYISVEETELVSMQPVNSSQLQFSEVENIIPSVNLIDDNQVEGNDISLASSIKVRETNESIEKLRVNEKDEIALVTNQTQEKLVFKDQYSKNINDLSASGIVFTPVETVSQRSDGLVESNPSQLSEIESKRPTLAEIASLPTTRSNIGKSSLRSLFVKEGCDLLGSKPFKSYVWSQLSTFAPLSQISAKSSDGTNYATARELSESTLPSVEIGFGLGVKTKSGVFAESGLQFAVWRERLSYIDPESIGYQTVITIDTMFTTEGIEISSDTTSIQINGSTEIVNFNSHKTVSVPLILGYEKRIASQFSMAMKVGAILNISTTSEGRILDQQMNVIDINQNDSTNSMVYNTKLSTQLMAGGQLVYHFSPGLDIYVNPEIRFTPKSNTVDTYSLNQRFVSPTIGAGLRYYF